MRPPKIYSKFIFFKSLVIGIAIVVFASLLLNFFLGINLLPYALGAILLLLLLLSFRLAQLTYTQLYTKMHDVNQIESLLWIYQKMKPGVAFRPLGHYACTPDFIKIIIETIDKLKPKTIVELGAGVSSSFISEYLITTQSEAHHFAVDHLKDFAGYAQVKMNNPQSRTIFAPLKKYELEGKDYKWYDTNALEAITEIDLLIIDGPPEDLNPLARYPALPYLFHKLSDKAIIILDDAGRKDEKIITDLWSRLFNLKVEYVYTEKGTAILQRK